MAARIPDSEEAGSEPSLKISRVDSGKVRGVLFFCEFEDDADAARDDWETTLDRIMEELNRYIQREKVRGQGFPARRLLSQ